MVLVMVVMTWEAFYATYIILEFRNSTFKYAIKCRWCRARERIFNFLYVYYVRKCITYICIWWRNANEGHLYLSVHISSAIGFILNFKSVLVQTFFFLSLLLCCMLCLCTAFFLYFVLFTCEQYVRSNKRNGRAKQAIRKA